ncbi:MAG: HAMP domain-containing histidine kinase [Clostridia bacterium]|nr:HAMP domain-containing histidine kinase [Clostridia bacterium]
MIKKLRRRLIILSVSALLAFFLILVLAMNLINYTSLKREADVTLDMLANMSGKFPWLDDSSPEPDADALPPDMSPEVPHESRFFTVTMTGACEIIAIDTRRIATVDDERAREFSLKVVSNGDERGFIESFRYLRTERGSNVTVTFLDCGRRLDVFRGFLLTSATIALAGFILLSVIIILVFNKILRPVAISYEKQKRFITDAGHEIKTPLTIIGANVDILAMEIGENECVEDIGRQTKRLTELTNELVTLARMEEYGAELPKIDFPISEVVTEAIEAFGAPTRAQGKRIVTDIAPLLTIKGDAASISRLVGILADNALKYSKDSSELTLTLRKQGKNVLLSVSNEVENAISADELEHLFDRFYRADPSRNSETGGHGIGLSLAHAIVTSHGGKITAAIQGSVFTVTATLPI